MEFTGLAPETLALAQKSEAWIQSHLEECRNHWVIVYDGVLLAKGQTPEEVLAMYKPGEKKVFPPGTLIVHSMPPYLDGFYIRDATPHSENFYYDQHMPTPEP